MPISGIRTMKFRRSILGVAFFLAAVVGIPLSGAPPQAAQQKKVKGKGKEKGKGKSLNQPLPFKKGVALSARALVQKPQRIAGAISWTIETRRHRGEYACMALSPDGKQLATGGMDGMIHLWDAGTGEHQKALVGHSTFVFGLAYSPDGKTLASAGSFEGTVRLWSPDSGLLLRTLEGHKDFVSRVVWSRDGKSLVAAGGNSGFMTFWDLSQATPIKTSETGNPITSLAWGPGANLVAVSGIKTGVQVWDLREGTPIKVLPVPGQSAASVAWSLDGKTIVGGAGAKTLVWDAESYKLLKTLDLSGLSVAFSPKGDQLAVSNGGAVYVWKGGFDGQPKKLEMPRVYALLWSPVGDALYGQTATTVKWASLASASPPREIDVAGDFPVRLSPGRPLVTGLSTEKLELWDLETGKSIATLEGHTGKVMHSQWSRDGKLLATAATDKTVRIWDAAGKPLRTLAGHKGIIHCVAWADGKTLATTSADKTVRIWHADSEDARILAGHAASVNAAAWSEGGKQLATGDENHVVLIWSPKGDKPLKELNVEGAVRSLAWSGNGKYLAVGIESGDVEVFAMPSGKRAQTFDGGGIKSSQASAPGSLGFSGQKLFGNAALAWAPKSSTTLLAGRSNYSGYAGQIWRLGTKRTIHNLNSLAPVNFVAWSPTGASAVISQSDRGARVFSSLNGQLRTTILADGKQVALVAANGHYHVADEEKCELICVVQTTKGQDTLSLKEFAAKYHVRNSPTGISIGEK